MKNKLQICFSFCFFQALLLLMLPIQWWLGALFAAVIHEVFHIFAVMLCDGTIRSVKLSASGAEIGVMPMSAAKQALCALAGPVGSFLCLFAAEYFPELAVCGLIQGGYNLLPIYPLDGGRVLRCLCSEPICIGMERFIMVIITGCSLWLSANCAELAVMILISAWHLMFHRKFSCKEVNLAVQ